MWTSLSRGLGPHEEGTFCEISGWHAAQLRQCCTAQFPHSLEADFRSEMQHLSLFFVLCVAFWQENSRCWGPRTVVVITSFIWHSSYGHTASIVCLCSPTHKLHFSYMNVNMSKKCNNFSNDEKRIFCTKP